LLFGVGHRAIQQDSSVLRQQIAGLITRG
jgi:hypothetical protein